MYIKSIKILLIIIGFSFINIGIACDCPNVPKLNASYLNEYKLVFRGSVKFVGKCNQINKANFHIQELYKGKSTQEIDLYFDCSSDCKMKFNPGETWLIYANYAQMGKPKVMICSRSRKLVDNELAVSTKYIASDLNFNDECELLRNTIGLHGFLEQDETAGLEHRNELPSKTKALLLIASSLVGLLILYFLFNKFFK